MRKRVVDLTAEELDKAADEAWTAAARDALAQGVPVSGSHDGRRLRYYADSRKEDVGPVASQPAENAYKKGPSKSPA